ncbi:MAG: VanZ family protein [Parvularculaceae bacterium]|nr:VanZ family protein [Parvularculaceae bacterium]
MLIAYLSLKPVGDPTAPGPWLLAAIAEWLLGDPSQTDKIGHYLAYGALAGCAIVGFVQRFSTLLLLAGVLAYGALFEGLQSLTPERTASLADMSANTFGALTGLIAGLLFSRLIEGDAS